MKRYQTQIALPHFGIEGQRIINEAKVTLIGLGGIGSPVALYLAGAGVGNLVLIDGDTVSEDNLHRQILFRESDIGRFKVDAGKEALNRLNSNVMTTVEAKYLTKDLAERYFTESTLIIDGTDNYQAKYLISDLSVSFKKPFISGGVSRYEIQFGLFNAAPNSTTYRDLYPEINTLENCSCQELGVLGPVVGTLGCSVASLALRYLLGESDLGKYFFQWNLHNFTQTKVRLPKPFSRTNVEMAYFYEITQDEFIKVRDGSWGLLDVRTEKERSEFNIGGEHVPIEEIEARLDEISVVPNLVVYCAKGGRSEKVAKFLASSPKFAESKIYNLLGGMEAWDVTK